MSETPPQEVVLVVETVAVAPVAVPAAAPPLMVRRFRGFLPVVVDVETGGFQPGTDALLQIAAVLIDIDPSGRLYRGETHSYHVRPFENSRLDPASLLVNKIDPWHPLRPAIDESDALQRIFRAVRAAIRSHGCRRAVLVGHNAAFDLAFLNAAVDAHRHQAQSVPSVLVFRYRDAGGRSAGPDRAGQSRDGRGPVLGQGLGALGHL